VNGKQDEFVPQSFPTVHKSSLFQGENLLLDNITFTPPPPPNMNTQPAVQYNVSGGAVMAMKDYFGSLFNGSISLNQQEQLATTDVMTVIWNSSVALDPWMQFVAAALTNVIRPSQPHPWNTFYNGAARSSVMMFVGPGSCFLRSWSPCQL